MKPYKYLALFNGSTGIIVPVNDSKTAEDIFDALDTLGLNLNMCLTDSIKDAEKKLKKWG